jgi:hypothetical protein
MVAAAVDPAVAAPVTAPEPAPVDDGVPRFEPSEPDPGALDIDGDDWRKAAEAEAAEGGWSLALTDKSPVGDEGGADPDAWTILEA